MTPEFDKDHYDQLRLQAFERSVYTAGQDYTDTPTVWYNGITIAFSPATELDDNRMIEVSVSYCAPEDAFQRNVGKYHALRKFFEECQYIHMPLGKYLFDNGVSETGSLLLSIFTV
jgi:hypothetical protein